MKDVKYTKGPWRYYYDQSDHYVHKVRVGAGLVCQMPGWSVNSDLQAEQEANARLITAAPDLLEALQELVSCEDTEDCAYADAVEKARDAIFKATGK